MKIMQFDYRKNSNDTSHREFIALTTPTKNYFGLDISELEDEEVAEVVYGVSRFDDLIKEALEHRTQWLKEKGYGTYYRNFSPEKMGKIITEEL